MADQEIGVPGRAGHLLGFMQRLCGKESAPRLPTTARHAASPATLSRVSTKQIELHLASYFDYLFIKGNDFIAVDLIVCAKEGVNEINSSCRIKLQALFDNFGIVCRDIGKFQKANQFIHNLMTLYRINFLQNKNNLAYHF
jgi:hypothetical protein